MSNSEMSAERREERGPDESGGGSRDELKAILDTIANQLQDADRRHTAALNEMQDRISGMGRQADSLRMRIPNQFAPAFEQIEAGIGELAHRLSDTGPGEFRDTVTPPRRSGAAPRQQRVSPSRAAHDAEALTSIYEASAYPGAEMRSGGAGVGESANSNIDEAWLESRFAEIARGIE